MEVVIITILIIAAVAFAAVKIYLVIQENRKTYVAANSSKMRKIDALNDKYIFYYIDPDICFSKSCHSKREFDYTDLREYLISCVSDERDYYRKLIKLSEENKRTYAEYCSDFDKIMQTATDAENQIYQKYRYFEKTEYKLCQKMKLFPTINIRVTVKKSYVSPKGRNNYFLKKTFTQTDLIIACNKAEQVIGSKNSAQYQRSIMTPSLRYDVMKRDGFRCVLCGASAKDGVKLHVDHIIPVSKGGKTEMSNLRTLCDRCNFGKSDKYDPYGPN